jgi:hypothetical protein
VARRLVPLVSIAALALVAWPAGAGAVPPTDQACVAEPCAMAFDVKAPPSTARAPKATLRVTLSPFKVQFDASGLGPPSAWVTGGDADAASSYALYIFERDDSTSFGGRVCVLDADLDCTGNEIPRPGKSGTYRRISLMAVKDVGSDPTAAEAASRLVTTHTFDPPLEIGAAGAPQTSEAAAGGAPATARTGARTVPYVAAVAAGLIALGWGLETRQRRRAAASQ